MISVANFSKSLHCKVCLGSTVLACVFVRPAAKLLFCTLDRAALWHMHNTRYVSIERERAGTKVRIQKEDCIDLLPSQYMPLFLLPPKANSSSPFPPFDAIRLPFGIWIRNQFPSFSSSSSFSGSSM
jgi:hypothetical protein